VPMIAAVARVLRLFLSSIGWVLHETPCTSIEPFVSGKSPWKRSALRYCTVL
jgi:hypothetical protein